MRSAVELLHLRGMVLVHCMVMVAVMVVVPGT